MMFNGSDNKKFPLSLSQLNILNLERTLSGTSVNNISTTVRLTGRIDFPMLQRSINLVIESDSSLRTRLCQVDGQVMQYHADFVKEEFPVYDFTNTSKDGIESWENAVTRELISLYDGPLYRFILFRDSENSGGILVKLHHIIADGWSQIMLCNKIGKTYLDLLAGKQPDLPEAPDYELHVLEEQEYFASKAFLKDEMYWRDIMSKAGEPSVLKSVNSAVISPVGRRMSFDLPQVLNHAIYTFCMKNRVAPFAVFYMALAIYFKRNGGESNFTIGVPIFNRTNYEFKQSTGMFVTTLPFYNEINDEWSLERFNEELADSWYEMLRHQRYPFTKIVELAGCEGRLFNIALSYQDSKIYESRDASVSLSGRWHYCGYQAEQLTIHLTNLKNHTQYAVDYDYLAQFFTETEIIELHNNLCRILEEALSEPDRPIYKLNILFLEQKEELLYKFNDTDKYIQERSVYQALMENNARHLNRAALIRNGERMTYGALFHQSTRYSSVISSSNLGPEPLVAILLPRGFELFAAMVGTLESGGAYMLLSETLPTERIKTILEQSGAAAIITDEKGKVRLLDVALPIITDEDVENVGYSLHGVSVNDQTPWNEKLAYVVYTSGSTGEPKGVEITHRNLLNLAQEMSGVYGHGAVLSVCNVGFDAFMLESIVALLNGRTIVLPLESEIDSPERIACLMNSYAVDFFSITPSRLSSLMQSSVFKKTLWRMESIVCGGENFPTELLKKLKTCTGARIYNQYGPSETTVAVSMKEISQTDKITIGSPMGNCKLYVLDQWMNPLPIGGNGKLFVGGKCVGRGYRNRPELTQKSFMDNPFISDDMIYDTGDMAYWTKGGELVLTGRADRQIKLRGLRIELQEIASCIESYPGVMSAHVKLCEVGNERVIGAYYTCEKEIKTADLLAHTATYLPQYMIPVFFIKVEKFETTANGKINEKLLPIPQSGGYDLELTQSALKIVEIFSEVLGYENFSAEQDFFIQGVTSLNALSCIIKIEEELGVKLRVEDLTACRNVLRLAEIVDSRLGINSPIISRTSENGNLKKSPRLSKYALTPIQQGIYVQSMLDPEGCVYNMPGAFLLEKEPDVKKLQKAFETLISSDAIFRTCFEFIDGGIYAVVKQEAPFELEVLSAESFEEASDKFLRPFDLSHAPLLRGGVWKCEELGKWYLFIDGHHIVGDGITTPVVLQRLDKAYRSLELDVKWDFYDYVYTRSEENREQYKKSLEYWVNKLKDMPQVMDIQGDFIRPKKFDYKGRDLAFDLSAATSSLVAEFCKESGYSEYVLFLCAYGMLLSALTGNRDMVIGTPVANRLAPQSENICGPFINTLPLRIKIDMQKTPSELLAQIKTEVMEMLDNQEVALEDIISALGLSRSEQNSLYKVMITQSPVDENALSFDGEKMIFRAIPTGCVKMDMILELAKGIKGHQLRFSYSSALFAHETVEFYGRCMEQIIKQIIKNKNKSINALSLIGPADKEKYIDEPNFRVTPFVNRPIHKILKSKAQSMADETAIIYHGKEISFSTLEKRASAIAAFLEEKGVKAGSCVALYLNRTPDMLAAMYGVLKVGATFMFMLKNFPQGRIRYMAECSGASVLLFDSVPDEVDMSSMPCPCFEIPQGLKEDFEDAVVGDDYLANIIFTSGSTGKPKGVMLRHRSVSNLYSQMKTLLEGVEGRVLCSTNSVFDCFIVETVIALALGRQVVLADEEEMMLPWKLAELIEKYKTGVFEMTPSRLWMCLGNDAFCKAAKYINIVLLGGEVVTQNLLNKFYEHSDGILMNMYGPTEATVFTTMCHLKKGEHITIGAPLQNTRTYVLDEERRPVIPTGVGELYVAGECLSAGYISNPELTESSFVDDIYFSGEKMYRTGDIVRMRLDGRFDYIGRRDTQIKLNGQRVELTEISGAMERVAGVRQAAVVALKSSDGSLELCAFAVCDESDPSKEEILSKISKELAPYMIPSRIYKLPDMPLTSTNKTDIQTLIKMANEVDTLGGLKNDFHNCEDQPSPQMHTLGSVEYVLSVWSRVLGYEVTDPEASFFDNKGGKSMAALSVLSYYYNDKLEMSLTEFYENPTALKQSQILMANSRADEEQNVGKDAFVTGATGFFGAHLVRELASEDSCGIICLMRDGSVQRLKERLEYYFGSNEAEQLMKRITVVEGDVSKEGLGIQGDKLDELCTRVGQIYHCAADVSHYSSNEEEYMNVNLGGTQRVIDFAKKCKATLYHISTCSVSGDTMKYGSSPVDFTERDLDIGQIWERNIYIKSKFLAEERVNQAIKEGLDAKIFRLGRLVGRASDGKFQINPNTNAFYLFVKGFLKIGAAPIDASQIKLDLMPIDICARQVLMLRDGKERVYHIMNGNPPSFAQIMQAADDGFILADSDIFAEKFRQNADKLGIELMALVMNNWRMMNNTQESISVKNDITLSELESNGFVMPEISLETVLKEFRKGE